MGLWVERPTVLLAARCDIRVVSPVPYCPPLPSMGPFDYFTRFRDLPHREVRHGIAVERPRYLLGPGSSTYALSGEAYYRGVRRAVDRIHESWGFDLIHAHFIYPDGVAGAKLARRYKVPLIVTEHAPWHPWLDRFGVRRQALAAARCAGEILAVSNSVREMILTEIADASVRVVPVGVDAELFKPEEDATRRRDQILFVGFVNYNKGIDVLLRAMTLLRARGEPAQLLLLGGSHYRNTRTQEDELRALAQRLSLDEHVHFLGHQLPDEVARLMRESAVVVLPSRAESFGAVLVEALACGTPVVATRCGGPEEIVDPTVGMLVSPGDPEALADALVSVLHRPAAYPVDTLRRYALDRFGWPRIVETIYERYAALAAPRVDLAES